MADITDPGARAVSPADASEPAVAAPATEQIGDIGLGLNPLVGYSTTDFVAGLVKVAERLVADPKLAMETSATLFQRLAAAGIGQADRQ